MGSTLSSFNVAWNTGRANKKVLRRRGRNMKGQKQQHTTQTSELQNPSRRKIVKTIVIGAGTLAAYHTLPTNWSKPIVEQIFLPAHAATSGAGSSSQCFFTEVSVTPHDIHILVYGFISPPIAGENVKVNAIGYLISGGAIDGGHATTTTDGNGKYSFDAYPDPDVYSKVDFIITRPFVDGSVSCTYVVPEHANPFKAMSEPNSGAPKSVFER
jgi:hypothetical protein